MTDDLTLFRHLKLIHRRTVKVERERLYADHAGEVTLRASGTKLRLEYVLYVPGLGASLLFRQKLYKASLRGKFNENVLYLNDNNENKIVICTRRNNIYCVKLIKKINIRTELKRIRLK